jgi:hypothetical protein
VSRGERNRFQEGELEMELILEIGAESVKDLTFQKYF